MNATREQVIEFIEKRLEWATENPEYTMEYANQAFGAACFYIDNLAEYDHEWDDIWNYYREKFIELL